MLTTFDLDDVVYDALRAGASGFLLKDASADQLDRPPSGWSPRRLAARPVRHPAADRGVRRDARRAARPARSTG